MTTSAPTPPDTPRTSNTALPTTASLRATAQTAANRGEPLVVMTSLKSCPYCDVVRQHHLLPLIRSGQIVAIQIDVSDRTTLLQGFAGGSTSPAEQATDWKARFFAHCAVF